MTLPTSDRDNLMAALIALLLLLVFVVDWLTPVGYAGWILYFLPIGVSLHQSRVGLPLLLAALSPALMALGLWLSPDGADLAQSVVNRGAASLACITLGVTVWRTLSARQTVQRLVWLQQGEARVAQALLGEQSVASLSQGVLKALGDVLQADVGAIYQLDEQDWVLSGCLGADATALTARQPVDHGLMGPLREAGAARLVRHVPPAHLDRVTALGRSAPDSLLLGPLAADGVVCGMVELGVNRAGRGFDHGLALLDKCAEPIGLALRGAIYRQKLLELLQETQQQKAMLQTHQEELKVTNEALDARNQRLQASEEELRVQGEELQALTEALEEKNQSLSLQKKEVEAQNARLSSLSQALQEKAHDLERSGRYKSEFLANMSHELRTPLNSLLLLSRSLLGNDDGNLTDDQLESLEIIQKGGRDLLALINDILDLAKVEAGKLTFHRDVVDLPDLLDGITRQLQPLATQKSIGLTLTVDPDGPATITSDAQRIEQILKNLLSNALKFTSTGAVTLTLGRLAQRICLPQGELCEGISIAVQDSGIGIPPERLQDVWEAFQQADGSTSRLYGGTGLGLTISRQLAWRLGGDILLTSTEGVGSTFTLVLPLVVPSTGEGDSAQALPVAVVPKMPRPPRLPATAAAQEGVGENVLSDDREGVLATDKAILIIEDDLDFARVVMKQVRKRGFKALATPLGEDGLALALRYKPAGIVLDLGLPDVDGEEVLQRLKHDARTRSIPVHIASGRDKDPHLMSLGAAGYLQKPMQEDDLGDIFASLAHFDPQRTRRVLVVEDDKGTQEGLKKLLGRSDTEITFAASAAQALEALNRQTYDCWVLDLQLPDRSGLDLLKELQADTRELPPVIIHTGKDLSELEYKALREYADRIVLKGTHSPERLLDEVSLFLHSVQAQQPARKRVVPGPVTRPQAVFLGQRVLVVDDDIRNTFALAKALKPYGLDIVLADDGQLALDKLNADPEIKLVLMDLMMPVMDGYEAMRRIRADERWAQLPVIALTAKAMQEDKQKCLQAGASDYLPKPIDLDRLVTMMQIWLSRRAD